MDKNEEEEVEGEEEGEEEEARELLPSPLSVVQTLLSPVRPDRDNISFFSMNT